jgi:hypothetical protein
MSRTDADDPGSAKQNAGWQELELAFFAAGDALGEPREVTQRVSGRLFLRAGRARLSWLVAACVLPLLSVGVWAGVGAGERPVVAAAPAMVAPPVPEAAPILPAANPPAPRARPAEEGPVRAKLVTKRARHKKRVKAAATTARREPVAAKKARRIGR